MNDQVKAIREEIERRIQEYEKEEEKAWDVQDDEEAMWWQGHRKGLKKFLSFLDSLPEVEIIPREESLKSDVEAAMKNLDEKIKLTKEHGSWKGVDVDKFMDEVRGRESDDLEEEFEKYLSENIEFDRAGSAMDKWNKGCHLNRNDLEDLARHFTEWQKRKMMDGWLKDRDGCFWDGVEEGKKAMEKQMMEGAVEGEIVKDISNKLAVTAKMNLDGFKFGDKVKILIIKDDETRRNQ